MQTRITSEEILAAARLLAKHERGQAAMRCLADALARNELDLDLLDQRAFLALLGGAWKGQGEAVTAAIRETLGK
ncbi:MAG: hypothetical protein V4773_17215 [Verrucomicrobiota bacterium]